MAALTLAWMSSFAAMLLSLRLFCLAAAADLITAWDWDNASQPISIFRSRPDLLAPILTPLEGIHQPKKMAPGYFFVAPYTNMQPGVYIYDNNADLIYTSFGSYGPGPSHAPRLCRYHGKPHLCFYQGVQHVGWGHGHGVIMDQNYRVVRSIEPSCTYQASSDMHEFYLIDGGRRALMTQYVRSVFDLCPWGLCDGLAYIQSGLFQEIDVESGECLFWWSSIEHVSPEDSYVLPSTTEISGSGESPEMPWDYFHINSIDKYSFDGGYLISARHVSTIYKIDGKTGEIVWRLGGKKNDYEYDNGLGDITFGFQHDVRWVSDGEDESVISLFDNASNGYAQTAGHSTGKIIRLDHKAKVARLVEKPLDPPWIDDHTHISHSQGNLQLNLPGFRDSDYGGQQVGQELGNRIMSFGNDPFFSEYRWNVVKNEETGEEVGEWEKVFYGKLASGYLMNYRVLKYDEWEGVPLTKPALWSYSRYGMNHTADNTNTMTLYVSWNGHTKIDTWVFYGANTEHARRNLGSRDWQILVGELKKSGFETIYQHERTFKYIYVEAFDWRERSLGRSLVQDTFTPSHLMAEHYCDELACQFMDTNNPQREKMRDEMKKVYDEWIKAKENSTEYDEVDIYESVYHGGGDVGRDVGKVVGLGVSLLALGILVVAVSVLVLRSSSTVQKSADKVVRLFGLKPRRSFESQKVKYLGLDSEDTDVDDDDAEMHRVLTRSSDVEITGDRQNGVGLEAERQAFWRTQST